MVLLTRVKPGPKIGPINLLTAYKMPPNDIKELSYIKGPIKKRDHYKGLN